MIYALHDGLATMVAIFALLLSLLGFYRYARGEGVGGDFLGAVVIAEMLILLDVVVGLALLAQGARPARLGMHLLYGAVAILCLPAFYAFLRGRDGRPEMLLWALMALFLFGIALRARLVAL